MMKAREILIIEDEHALGTALSMVVQRMGHLPSLAASAAAGGDALVRSRPAAVVLDIGLPDRSGLELLERWRAAGDATPVLVITAHATLDHAIRAQKSGATGYLTKPLDLRQFEQTLAGLLAQGVPLAAAGEVRAATLIGAALCLRQVFLGIARACAGEVPVLISGPGGSGKSLAATVIHAHGLRAGEPLEFVAAAEVKDFGDLTAHRGGSLVVEEVTELAPECQRQLASWLAAPAAGRARVLATTVHEPREAVAAGRLREDLYYALSALTISMPALRERSGDIPALGAFFTGLGRAGELPSITPPAMAALQAYGWPGNVRELRHVLDYALSVSGGGPVFLSHLPPQVAAAAGTAPASAPGELESAVGRWLESALAGPEDQRPSYDVLLDKVEAVMLRHLLERCGGKPTHLAAALQLNRATLRQKLRRLGLHGEAGGS